MIPVVGIRKGCVALTKAVSGFEPSIIIDEYFSFADDASGRHKATRGPGG